MVEGTAMKTECYPISLLPGLSRLFLDFAERREALDSLLLRECLFHRVDDHPPGSSPRWPRDSL